MKYLSIYRCQNLGTLVSSMTVGGNRETGSSWSPDTPLAPTQTLPQYCLHNFWNWTLRIDQTSQETTSYPQIMQIIQKLFIHSTISSITSPTKLARMSLSMFIVHGKVHYVLKAKILAVLPFGMKFWSPFKGYFLSFWKHLTHCDRWTERQMDIRTCRGAIAANKMFYVLFVFIYYQVYSM